MVAHGRVEVRDAGSVVRHHDLNPAAARPLDAAQAALPPELWGRLDERLVFAPLSRDQVRSIAGLQLAESARALFGEREITLQWDDKILDFLLDNGGFNSATGARQMRSAIRRHVEEPIAAKILRGKLEPGEMVRISIAGSKVVTTATAEASRLA